MSVSLNWIFITKYHQEKMSQIDLLPKTMQKNVVKNAPKFFLQKFCLYSRNTPVQTTDKKSPVPSKIKNKTRSCSTVDRKKSILDRQSTEWVQSINVSQKSNFHGKFSSTRGAIKITSVMVHLSSCLMELMDRLLNFKTNKKNVIR